ncbi:MAG: porin [Nevskiaceae bacterium]|nr:MAG: porin [Nevskiaceae bacterium]TBR71976.1 MAG: porin [Nevskiaceae bacterium]
MRGIKKRGSGLRASCAAAALSLAVCPLAANAVSFSGNNWNVDISGFINAFYTTASCSGSSVGGYALAGEALGCGGSGERTSIGNGLLPNALITKFKTQQQGIDIGAQISFMNSIATGNGITRNGSIDVRQAFFTLGTAEFGTVKLGRDYGIFGYNGIINDMTLLGVGAPAIAFQDGQALGGIGRVSFGHIGAGYTYLGNYSQIVYTSPTFNGLSFTGGVFNPSDNLTGNYDGRTVPQVQGAVNYGNGPFKVWVGAKAQKFYQKPVTSPDKGFWMSAGEIGGSVAAGPLSLMANVQAGRGIGILSDGDQGPTTGVNYLVQANYQILPKWKVGLNYGVNRNTKDPGVAYANFKSNANATAGLYYQITKAINLDLELGKTWSKDYLGNQDHANSVAVGGMIFF